MSGYKIVTSGTFHNQQTHLSRIQVKLCLIQVTWYSSERLGLRLSEEYSVTRIKNNLRTTVSSLFLIIPLIIPHYSFNLIIQCQVFNYFLNYLSPCIVPLTINFTIVPVSCIKLFPEAAIVMIPGPITPSFLCNSRSD